MNYRTKAAMKILMELTRKEAFEFLHKLDDVQKKICIGDRVFPFDKMTKQEAVREVKTLLGGGEIEIPVHLKGHMERFLELMINERAPMDELLFECNSALNVLLYYDLLKPDDPNGAVPEAENTAYYFSDEDMGEYEQNKQYVLSETQAKYGCVDSVQVLGEQREINIKKVNGFSAEEFNRLMENWLKNNPRIEFSTEAGSDKKQGSASYKELRGLLLGIRLRLVRIENTLESLGIGSGLLCPKYKGGGAPEPSCSIPCPPRK